MSDRKFSDHRQPPPATAPIYTATDAALQATDPVTMPVPLDQLGDLIDDIASRVGCLDEAAAARAEDFADLADRVAALEAPARWAAAAKEPPAQVDALVRDHRGRVVQREDVPTFEERMRARREAEDAAFAARRAAERKGLHGGFWRDPFGLVRTPDGRLAIEVDGDWVAPPTRSA